MAKLNEKTVQTGFLFPTLPQAAKPAGLAGLAASAVHASDGHEVEYRYLESRSALNRTSSRRGFNFKWSVNPYRGCEFGCRYCYARYTHEFMELRKPEDFEQQIFIKKNAAVQFDRELATLPAGEGIAIGTATDPYQPIERREQVTRSLLEALARRSGFRVGVVTKSVLVLRDIDLLSKVASKHDLTLNMTITTDNVELARKLEPRAPRPDLRFRAVRRLREAGLQCGILVSPAMPGINDSLAQLDRMGWLAAAARASHFTSGALFLKPCSKHVFQDFVVKNFPHLAADYERRFADHAFQSAQAQAELAKKVEIVSRKHKLNLRPDEDLIPSDPGAKPVQRAEPQLDLSGIFPVSRLLATA